MRALFQLNTDKSLSKKSTLNSVCCREPGEVGAGTDNSLEWAYERHPEG